MLRIRYLPFIIPLVTSKTITVYQTNTHTFQEVETELQTTLITRWTTIDYIDQPTTTTTTSTITITTTLDTSSSSSDFASQVVELHNEKRSLHNAQPLSWSDELATFAQQYAARYNCNGTLVHSHSIYGENLALGYNTSAAIQAWVDEESLYDYSCPQFSKKTGHFTQLVWNNTNSVGCAVKDCGDYFGQYLVCEYDPAGNVLGAFDDNVFAG